MSPELLAALEAETALQGTAAIFPRKEGIKKNKKSDLSDLIEHPFYL